jgi:hypothetical protein
MPQSSVFAAPFDFVLNISVATTYAQLQQFCYKPETITQRLFVWLPRKIANPLFPQKDATIREPEAQACAEKRPGLEFRVVS